MPAKWVLGVSLALLLSYQGRGGSLWAANGDVLSVSTLLEGVDITDITLDTSGNPPEGSFWVAGKQNDNIYQVSLDLNTLLNTISNPHGAGQFPDFVLTWGIAYRASSDTLFVLASDGPDFKVKEVTTGGTEVGAPGFTIQPPAPFATTLAARSLSYDTVTQELWYLDEFNDNLVRTGFDGISTAVLSLPGDNPAETTLRGDGVAFELDGVQPRIYVSYGDVFQQDPSRILQLKDDGEATGIEVPLSVAGPVGFQTYQIGQQLRLAVVLNDGRMAEIERVVPDPIPPSQLQCSLTGTNQVKLTWTNHGAIDGDYGDVVIIVRNGVPFGTTGGGNQTFTDMTPLQGTSTYSLRAKETPGGPQSPEGHECQVTVGTGGIIRWVPFAGTSPFDIARNPLTGDVYVTDNIEGKIFRFDDNLDPLGEIPSPWSQPGGITFVETITIQDVAYQQVLAVARTDGTLVKVINTSGSEITTFPVESTEFVEGLTYLPAAQRFAFVETHKTKGDRTVVVTDSSGARIQAACAPPTFLNLEPIERGLTYDPLEDTLLTVFADGVNRELFSQNCGPSGFEINLESMGEGFDDPGFFGGVQISDNTLLVCGRKSRALFQALIFPAGPDFVRGDFDGNGAANLTDAISSASYLFQQGPAPTCPDAADINDDGILDVSDPVYTLFHLFLGGQPPPPPWPSVGKDPTFRDNLGCEEASAI
jgi:hypothetical protein